MNSLAARHTPTGGLFYGAPKFAGCRVQTVASTLIFPSRPAPVDLRCFQWRPSPPDRLPNAPEPQR